VQLQSALTNLRLCLDGKKSLALPSNTLSRKATVHSRLRSLLRYAAETQSTKETFDLLCMLIYLPLLSHTGDESLLGSLLHSSRLD
jgi:hypothetical protein